MSSHLITTADGANLHIAFSGLEQGPTMLLLHGGAGSSSDFTPILPLLNQHFRVIAIDSRGHGSSTMGTIPLSYQQISLDVTQVLHDLSIPKTHVLGFSDGGTVALILASKMPHLIDSVTVIGSTWRAETNPDILAIFANLTGAAWQEKFPEMYQDYVNKNPEPDFNQLILRLRTMWAGNNQDYPHETVQTIHCPVNILRGQNDFLCSQAENEALKQALIHAKSVSLSTIADAGHDAIHDDPEATLSLLQHLLFR